MTKVRDKLRALHAPRPTEAPESPDGASTAPPPAPRPTPKPRPEPHPPQRPTAPSPPPKRRDPGPVPHVQSFPKRDVTVLRARDLSAWRAAKGEPDAPSLLAAGREAWSRKDGTAAARHLEAALDAGLHGRDWWAAARLLADVYLAAERRDDARYVLEELVERPSADPFPFLALADLVEAEDAPRARTLRARARAIAPWC